MSSGQGIDVLGVFEGFSGTVELWISVKAASVDGNHRSCSIGHGSLRGGSVYLVRRRPCLTCMVFNRLGVLRFLATWVHVCHWALSRMYWCLLTKSKKSLMTHAM